MTRIITLLNEKNHYLEKFFSQTEAELTNFAQGQFDNLDIFYQNRERILDIIKYIDAQIEKAQAEMTPDIEISSEEKKEVRAAMMVKDEYVDRIIEQDIQVLACIESAKNSIIKELQEVRQSRKAVSGYKVASFKNRLNEEV